MTINIKISKTQYIFTNFISNYKMKIFKLISFGSIDWETKIDTYLLAAVGCVRYLQVA